MRDFPYPEDKEARLRLRYAVQMALNSAGYRPADRNHLGCVEVPWPKGTELRKDPDKNYLLWLQKLTPLRALDFSSDKVPGPSKIDVPFEWFLKETSASNEESGTPKQAVLVLWLKEEAFADYPLGRLLQLQTALEEEVRELYRVATPSLLEDWIAWKEAAKRPRGWPMPEFEIIGPRSSDTLRAMANDLVIKAMKHNDESTRDPLNRTTIYSSEATTPDILLLPNALKNDLRLKPFHRALFRRELERHIGIHKFANLVQTDAALLKQLAKELRLRNVDQQFPELCQKTIRPLAERGIFRYQVI